MLTSIINPLDHLSEIITNVEVLGTLANYRGWGGGCSASVRFREKAESICAVTVFENFSPQMETTGPGLGRHRELAESCKE